MSTSANALSDPKVGIQPLAPILLAIAGIIGGVCGLGLWNKIDPVFVIPMKYLDLPESASMEQMFEAQQVIRAANLKNHGIDYGLVGLALGISIGLLAGGRSRMRAILMSGLLGTIFGVLGGMACTTSITAAYDAGGHPAKVLGITLEPIAMTLLSHAAGWGLTGFGAGLGLCWALGGILFGIKGAIGGAIGGLATAIAFTLIWAFAFPGAASYSVIPETGIERLIWAVEGGLLVGLCIALATGSREKKNATSAVA